MEEAGRVEERGGEVTVEMDGFKMGREQVKGILEQILFQKMMERNRECGEVKKWDEEWDEVFDQTILSQQRLKKILHEIVEILGEDNLEILKSGQNFIKENIRNKYPFLSPSIIGQTVSVLGDQELAEKALIVSFDSQYKEHMQQQFQLGEHLYNGIKQQNWASEIPVTKLEPKKDKLYSSPNEKQIPE